MKLTQKAKFVLATAALLLAYVVGGGSKSDQYFRNHAFLLNGAGGSCSGEQVRAPSGKDYILTASHCKKIALNGVFTVTAEDGTEYFEKIIAEDPASDLLLVEGVPHLRGLSVADHLSRFQHVRTFTHGQGLPTYETSGVIVGDGFIQAPVGGVDFCVAGYPKYSLEMSMFGPMCILGVEETATTAKIVPGSSGGLVVNDSGQLVGVVSAAEDGIGYIVRLSDIQDFLKTR